LPRSMWLKSKLKAAMSIWVSTWDTEQSDSPEPKFRHSLEAEKYFDDLASKQVSRIFRTPIRYISRESVIALLSVSRGGNAWEAAILVLTYHER
jgi:hypothetical protein